MNNNMTTYYLHNEGNIFAKGSVLVQFRKIVGEEKGILSTCVSDSYLIIYIYWDYKDFPFWVWISHILSSMRVFY